jgi:hypothetical protein
MKNNIVTLILVIVVGMIAFWYLTKTDTTPAYLVSDVKTSDSVDAKYIYTILQKMAQVTLDDSVFSNPVFKNLKDNTVSFSPQSAGRNNPFAPVGTDTNTPGQGIQSTTTLPTPSVIMH